MCNTCGQPDWRCTCGQSQQPFCDQCTDQSICADKLDSACVIYHQITFQRPDPPPSRLINLNLPNNTPAETIFEAIDAAFGQISPITGIGVKSSQAIKLDTLGIGGRTITANLILSGASGNTAVINSDGLFVPPQSGRVKVDPWSAPYFLSDALIGGSGDGIVNLTFRDELGILVGLPEVNLVSLVEGIANNPTAISELTNTILNEIINNPVFLDLLETALLNDSTFITNLTQAIINNPASQALLCQQIAACQSGSTGCVAPTVTDAFLVVNGGGSTVNLHVTFTPASPAPADNYIIFYRPVGGSSFLSQAVTTSPIVINNLPAADYEGYLVSDCGGGSFSSGSTFTTSGDYFNVNTTNDLTGMTIQTVSGIPGYTLHGPVGVGGSDTGLHGAFTGAISMGLSGTAGITGNASLVVNSVVIGCQTITSGTSPTIINFPSHTFVAGDQIQVVLNTGHC